MKRLLSVAVLLLLVTSLGAQVADQIRSDPSCIWAEGRAPVNRNADSAALDALIAELASSDEIQFPVPAVKQHAAWESYRADIKRVSHPVSLPGGAVLRYLKRSEIESVFAGRRRKVSELLSYAGHETDAARARRYLSWAGTYLQTLPGAKAERTRLKQLHDKLGDGPLADIRMRNIETELEKIEAALGIGTPSYERRTDTSVAVAVPEKNSGTPEVRTAQVRGDKSFKSAPVSASEAYLPRADAEARKASLVPSVSSSIETSAACCTPPGIKAHETATPAPVWKGEALPPIFLMASASFAPSAAFGFRAGIAGSRFGAYVSGMTDFRRVESAYACLSDGSTSFGRIWTSGAVRRHQASLCAGPVIMPWTHLGFYAGAGYGCSLLYWEDSAGRWAEVSDLSVRGAAAEAGLLFRPGHLALSLGAGTVAFRTISLQLGIGIAF